MAVACCARRRGVAYFDNEAAVVGIVLGEEFFVKVNVHGESQAVRGARSSGLFDGHAMTCCVKARVECEAVALGLK